MGYVKDEFQVIIFSSEKKIINLHMAKTMEDAKR